MFWVVASNQQSSRIKITQKMVRQTRNEVIIVIKECSPEDVIKGLKTGIVDALQYQFSQYDPSLPFSEELAHGNFLLLELLKALMQQEE